MHKDGVFEYWKFHWTDGTLNLLDYYYILLISSSFGVVENTFAKQRYADEHMGWDFVAYHSYGKRRNHLWIGGMFQSIFCILPTTYYYKQGVCNLYNLQNTRRLRARHFQDQCIISVLAAIKIIGHQRKSVCGYPVSGGKDVFVGSCPDNRHMSYI